MTTAFLKSTAAAALVMFSLGAQADVVPLNFENLGATGRATTEVPTDAPFGAPAVGSRIAGFAFSGAYAYTYRTLYSVGLAADTKPGAASYDSTLTDNGFIMNRPRAIAETTAGSGDYVPSPSDAESIEITFNGLNDGLFLKSLSFDLFVTNDSTPTVDVYNAAGQSVGKDFTKGDGLNAWSRSAELLFAESLQFNRIRFTADPFGGIVGFDNIKIELYSAADPGTVPEPASYALVALALLAAGGASRRRNA